LTQFALYKLRSSYTIANVTT